MAEPSANRIVKLNKIIPALNAVYTDTGSWSGLTQGWNNYSRLGVDIPWFQSFIDLSGYTRQDDLTFYLSDRAMLDPGVYRSTIGQAGTPAYNFFTEMVTIVTSGPVNAEQLIAEFIATASPNDGNPSYLASSLDWDQVLVGNNTLLAVDNEVGGQALLTKLRNHYFGSGEPTNNDRLYITRFLVVSEASDIGPDDLLSIPACRIVLRGMASLEKEYVNIMRLKRSYELAQRVD
tara:strand:- start:760 stop:1461 length:702 start_codon:yes stop_codon:yes gene_type:complete